MWMKIKCPACQTEGSSSLVESSYKGQYRCWKCRALYSVEIDNGELVSYQPITEEDLEEIKAKKEAEKKGLVYTKPQAVPQPPAPAPPAQEPFAWPKVPDDEPVAPQSVPGVAPAYSIPSTSVDTAFVSPPVPKPPDSNIEVSGLGGKAVKIDGFNYGFIVIDGKQYGYDVVILPDGTVREREPGKGRIGSHSITKNQLEPLARANPEVIIVGTGVNSMAKLSADAQVWQQKTGNLKILAMSSPEAVQEFNKLATEGKRVAALIHVIC